MMAGPRTSRLLSEWQTLSENVDLPASAPRPARKRGVGLWVPLLAAGSLLFVVAIQRPNQVPGATTWTSSPTTIGTPGALASPATSPSLSMPPAPGTPLPRVGGTCLSTQIVPGASVPAFGYGAVGTTVAFLTQELRNTGAPCILALPGWIGVAGADPNATTIPVLNVGSASERRVGSGEAVTVVFQATWSPINDDASPCGGAIEGVSKVEFPVATGVVDLDTGIAWKRVCASPPSVTIKLKD